MVYSVLLWALLAFGPVENNRNVRRLLDTPVVSAESVVITTQHDLTNYGGIITGNDSVRLQSLHGNVANVAAAYDFTTVFTRKKFWGSDSTTISVGTG